MGQIVPKLNLNKTPSVVENNSLIFAKNIRLDVDNTIHKDYAILPMSQHIGNTTMQLVNYGNILKRAIHDIELDTTSNHDSYFDITMIYLKGCIGIPNNELNIDGVYSGGEYYIAGVISNNREFYMFIHGVVRNDDHQAQESAEYSIDAIIKYDEDTDLFSLCPCNWNYSGGKITGNVINNLRGEKILVIGESECDKLVPLKCINLNKSKFTDDETIYTQTPNIPITNLNYSGNFDYIIPNGIYQFYIRYKIRNNYYTDWFPASVELFAGNSNTTLTSFGTVKYVNKHMSSNQSFKFRAEHLYKDRYAKNFESFQIGFIVSNDDQITARAWKHFNFDKELIYFDYKQEDGIEIPVIDLIGQTYQIYDVKNITSFKNKVYISNYIETDFNDKTLNDIASNIKIEVKDMTVDKKYAGYSIDKSIISGEDVITGLKINNVSKSFTGDNGIIHDVCTYKGSNVKSIAELFSNSFEINQDVGDNQIVSILNNSIEATFQRQNLKIQQDKVKKEIAKLNSEKTQVQEPTFHSDIIDIHGDIADNDDTASDILNKIYNTKRFLNKNAEFVNINGTNEDKISITIMRKYTYLRRDRGFNGGFRPNPDIPPIVIEGGDGTSGGGSNIGTGTSEWGQWTTETRSYGQDITISFRAFKKYLNYTDISSLINYTTLIPYQQYKFYIHFVKQNGETTNGYVCNNNKKITCPYKQEANCIIYPVFKNINIPNGYVACFFSIVHTAVNSATVFNIKQATLNDGLTIDKNGKLEASCLDISLGHFKGNATVKVKQLQKGIFNNIFDDINRYPIFDVVETLPTSRAISGNIDIIKPELTTHTHRTFNAKFHYSSDSANARYFGADGILTLDKNTLDETKLAYCVDDYKISESDDIELVKCTPYIKDQAGSFDYDAPYELNLLGYICNIFPLDRQRSIDYYTDGASCHRKLNSNIPDTGVTNNFSLKELVTYTGDVGDDKKSGIWQLYITPTNSVAVYSNYNLNWLGLTEEPKEAIKTYYEGTESNSNTNRIKHTVVLRLFSSLTLFGVYCDLPMYKTITRKIYSRYREGEQVKFENTIRSSELEGDEVSLDIFKFHPNDYYNVPTNRGIITNLVSVGDNIICHTEDSIFRFTGSNNITSSDGEIVTNESTPFDTGISEAFGSDYGFAGLQNKEDSIITESGYIFFDRNARIVYMYSGQGQINKLSDGLEKLFKHRNIRNISFANDYYNNRFFMCVVFNEFKTVLEDGKYVYKEVIYPATLSFSLNQEVKSFISLHDFYYYKAFNTRTKCYFINNNYDDISTIDKTSTTTRYDKLDLTIDRLYPTNSEDQLIPCILEDDVNSTVKRMRVKKRNSIIDVIYNANYEIIKTLNSVHWNSNEVDKSFDIIDDSNPKTLNMAEDVLGPLPCKAIRIYSDTCMTPLMDFSDISNLSHIDEMTNLKRSYQVNSMNSYKYPRYNQGYWSFNYFRNIFNKNKEGDTDITSKAPNYFYNSDNNSLIEGKYFVVRFIFNKPFKFDTLSLNIDNKL